MKPETSTRIWLSSPHMGGAEMNYINEAIALNHVFPLGPNVTGFEEDIKAYTGSRYCTCLVSGTSAIHLALIILGIGQGDEVICSSFTFSASANPILYQGATPIFIDSEPATWNLKPETLEEAITDRLKKGKKPKAIIPVHLYGMPCRIDEVMRIAAKYEIPVIEDAAESFGSTFEGRHTGTFGDFGIYSFNGNKIITTSGGGAMVSAREEYCNKAFFLSTQARDKAPHYQHSQVGYNYRMSNISAGIGRGQMTVITDRIRMRRENYSFYKKAMADFEGIRFQDEPDDRYFSNHWLTTILIDPDKTYGVTREEIRLELEKHNIESRPLWKPMHLQPVFEGYPYYGKSISEDFFNIGLCLPSGSNLEHEDRERIVSIIAETILIGRK